MKKYICSVCGYIIEDERINNCPICNSSNNKIKKILEINDKYLSNNLGIAKDIEILDELKEIFFSECLEVGLYLAMSKIAKEEQYIEISDELKKIAYEEGEHAAILAKFIGYNISRFTENNLKNIIRDEYEATQDKLKLAKKSKEMGLDIIYELLDKMYKDEVKHGKKFQKLLKKYFEN